MPKNSNPQLSAIHEELGMPEGASLRAIREQSPRARCSHVASQYRSRYVEVNVRMEGRQRTSRRENPTFFCAVGRRNAMTTKSAGFRFGIVRLPWRDYMLSPLLKRRQLSGVNQSSSPSSRKRSCSRAKPISKSADCVGVSKTRSRKYRRDLYAMTALARLRFTLSAF